jgi:putative tryptophan/tyrosine transport system substrate-binding protein
MAIHIGRREFVATLGATAAAWPLAAPAQQATPVIGNLSVGSHKEDDYLVTPFLQGLQEAGFVAGGHVAIEYRWAENQIDRLPGLAVMTDGRRKLLAADRGVRATAAGRRALCGDPL